MDDTTLKMAMAGFFHDIGKFADRDTLGVSEQYFNDNAGLYLPFRDGRYTHHHALYTAAFIDQKKDVLPPELNSGGWGDGDAFINLAAGHHNPDTPMQQIVTVADWLTSEMDRDVFDPEKSGKIAVRDYKKTRLLPLFEQLRKKKGMSSIDEFVYAYPLLPLSPENIFPLIRENAGEEGNEREEYRSLFDRFSAELAGLLHRDENPALWFEHFESLFMIFASSIPAARVGNVVPDVSLYDHCRLTAAFAAALYLYHRTMESLNADAIKDKHDKKFLLINGNFFGIQKFIFSGYGDTRKFRSKILRGRSFYVVLLTELAADMLARETGLPSISVILNAAGRFTLLAPNTEKTVSALDKTKRKINEWLMDISFGEVSIGLSSVRAAYRDFTPSQFTHLWDEMGTAGEVPKFQKIDLSHYGGVVSGYLDQFNNKLRHPMCPLCGKRPADETTEHMLPSDEMGAVCRICRDHVHIGERLVKDDKIFVLSQDTSGYNKRDLFSEPIFGTYQVLFSTAEKENLYEGSDIIRCWDISLDESGHSTGGVTKKLVNGYVPVYQEKDMVDERFLLTGKSEGTKLRMMEEMAVGDIKSLHHIAAAAIDRKAETGKSLGIDALGALKADVDSLGLLMGCGLEQDRYTLSRLAALSRQFNYFFAVYVPHLLQKDRRFNDVYTVFSGGDDLFLIGPWNRTYELALHLRDRFADYVCRNPEVHFSAGIAMHKPSTPLNSLAEQAEMALERSKSLGRERFTMFYETVEWERMDELEDIRSQFETWLKEELITKSMLYRMNRFIDMAAIERLVLGRNQIFPEDMECLKWRAMFSYSAVRNIAKNEKDAERRKQTVTRLMGEMVLWLDRHRSSLRIPLWNLLYNHR